MFTIIRKVGQLQSFRWDVRDLAKAAEGDEGFENLGTATLIASLLRRKVEGDIPLPIRHLPVL